MKWELVLSSQTRDSEVEPHVFYSFCTSCTTVNVHRSEWKSGFAYTIGVRMRGGTVQRSNLYVISLSGRLDVYTDGGINETGDLNETRELNET